MINISIDVMINTDRNIDVDKIRCIVVNLLESLESSPHNLTLPEDPSNLLFILPLQLKVNPHPILFQSNIPGRNPPLQHHLFIFPKLLLL